MANARNSKHAYNRIFCDTYWPYFKHSIFTRINNDFVFHFGIWNGSIAFWQPTAFHISNSFSFYEIDAAFKLLPPIREFDFFKLSVCLWNWVHMLTCVHFDIERWTVKIEEMLIKGKNCIKGSKLII